MNVHLMCAVSVVPLKSTVASNDVAVWSTIEACITVRAVPTVNCVCDEFTRTVPVDISVTEYEYGAAVTKDGEAAGTLTSPCESPTLGKVIGLAVLETAQAEKGNQVQVELAGGGVANATVADFPTEDLGTA